MNKFAVFLRGVNVGGKNMIKMADLKHSIVKKGYNNVSSLLNSGNIIVESKSDKSDIYTDVKKIIKTDFNLDIELIVKNKKEISSILDNDPFGKEEDDKSIRIVAMLSKEIDKTKLSTFHKFDFITEKFYPGSDILYIYYVNGIGNSKFTNSFIEKQLNTVSTSRNWNTLEKMTKLL